MSTIFWLAQFRSGMVDLAVGVTTISAMVI